MLQAICKKILYGWMGFREDVTEDIPAKFIICLAPHTSNWDFLMGQLYSQAAGFHCNFMTKKEWFFWPLGILFRKMGGIPVYRNKKTHATDSIAEQAKEMDEFHLCITPEGTRSKNAEWKKGFYYIALKAGIPILLYGLDYEEKVIYCHRTFIPTGNIDKDLPEIKEYFRHFKGKHPERFAIE